MSFYKIAWIEDPEMESGIYNQLQFELDYELEFSDKCYSNLKNYELPNFEPVFGKLILHPNAQLTDFLSIPLGEIGGKGFIINERTRELLSTLNLPLHQYYPLSIYQKNGEKLKQNYFWLQIIASTNIIDFTQSEFCLITAKFGKLPEFETRFLNIKNFQDLIEENKNTSTFSRVSYKKIVLNEIYLGYPLDIFFMPQISIYGIISENLKNKIEQYNITGLMPFEKLNIIS